MIKKALLIPSICISMKYLHNFISEKSKLQNRVYVTICVKKGAVGLHACI